MKRYFSLICAAAILAGCASGPVTPETVRSKIVEDGGTGAYKAIMFEAPAFEAHTVFAPQDLSVFGKKKKLPVVVWGNGACTNSPWEHYKFLNEIASHGFLVIATGHIPMEEAPYHGPRSTSEQQIQSVDWAIAQNADKESPFYGRIDTDAIAAAGFLPVLVPSLADTNAVAAIMDRVDALVLTGAIKGSDTEKRNKFDFMLIRMALDRGLPVVGFCRGHQVINRYFGGEIAPIPKNLDPKIVHMGKVSPYIKDAFHEMEVVPGTWLSQIVKSRRVTINTSHKYHVTKLGDGLVVSARSDDGVIEALEHKTLPVVGFQFHPERSFRGHPEHLTMIRRALDPAAR